MSSQISMVGAGGDWTGCDLSTVDGTLEGGGAGGTFQGQGGGSSVTITANAGVPTPPLPPGVHGGCRGGNSQSGHGGAGGGAIYFAARALSITSDVYAYGGGGALATPVPAAPVVAREGSSGSMPS